VSVAVGSQKCKIMKHFDGLRIPKIKWKLMLSGARTKTPDLKSIFREVRMKVFARRNEKEL
jgi:hypothetical protein